MLFKHAQHVVKPLSCKPATLSNNLKCDLCPSELKQLRQPMFQSQSERESSSSTRNCNEALCSVTSQLAQGALSTDGMQTSLK